MLRLFPFIREFTIKGCNLTYNDLYDIIKHGGNTEKYCLSGNTFICENGEKSSEQIEKIDIGKKVQESFKFLDLRKNYNI